MRCVWEILPRTFPQTVSNPCPQETCCVATVRDDLLLFWDNLLKRNLCHLHMFLAELGRRTVRNNTRRLLLQRASLLRTESSGSIRLRIRRWSMLFKRSRPYFLSSELHLLLR